MSEQVIKNMDEMSEQLSALIDGELSRDQVRFLLRSVEAESDFARRWSRYQLISATLKREFVALPLGRDFSAAVWAKLDAQSGAASAPRAYTALRWLGGGAIAAAVAVVALVVSRPADHAEQGGAAMLAQQVAPAAVQPALQPNRAYLPLAPTNSSPLAGFDANKVMQASFDSVLPSLYAPNGQLLSRNYLGDGAAPYVLRIQSTGTAAAPVFGPLRPTSTQPNPVSTQP
ncbi:MAG: hypothetical protein E6K53_12655 [Gammaproteobacteria bacterium]|nr:MAG: hypothetical protein E6K53_12655 [Gammaproteobacteria bacterium]